ncbi:MAG TPA: carboxypeptidase-like regulatory domain-containing protein [Gemmatimonadaceae bacterium]|nr:carboxypeptidase-like regulatory domain-containing protein [Gemmatimonadaceae bacterium]
MALCLATATLHAQTEFRSDVLIGRVTDLTGKPVADAQVGATSLASGLTRSHTTDDEGRYRIFFPETAPRYMLQVKRLGFSPVQRTVTRRTKGPEQMIIDMQLGGAPLALSMVEINGNPEESVVRRERASSIGEKSPTTEATVPNPVAEILSLKDTLHLSAVQIVALTDVADSLQAKNSALYKRLQLLLAKSREAGDITQMAGTVAMMLEEASRNTRSAVAHAEKLLQPEQWLILPQVIRDLPEAEGAATSRQNH